MEARRPPPQQQAPPHESQNHGRAVEAEGEMMMHATQCPYLGLYMVEPGCWSYCDITEPRALPRRVGPLYPRKDVAVADFRRYAYECWGWGEPPEKVWPTFHPITVAEVDAHNGTWMVKWRTGRAWRVGPLRRGEWDADRLERLTECGMPLDDEGQPTVVKA